MTTVYVSIGNSDDKLSQDQWHAYCAAVDKVFDYAARYVGSTVHGRWYSLPNEQWQNACWCVEFDDGMADIVAQYQRELSRLAGVFHQDSIAWAECPATEFLTPGGAS